jgi:hypothetical protein
LASAEIRNRSPLMAPLISSVTITNCPVPSIGPALYNDTAYSVPRWVELLQVESAQEAAGAGGHVRGQDVAFAAEGDQDRTCA